MKNYYYYYYYLIVSELLLWFQEVGSIIGKRGEHIKFIRDQSGAKINISDGSCPERIVTITGSTGTINQAFGMICSKLQQVVLFWIATASIDSHFQQLANKQKNFPKLTV